MFTADLSQLFWCYHLFPHTDLTQISVMGSKVNIYSVTASEVVSLSDNFPVCINMHSVIFVYSITAFMSAAMSLIIQMCERLILSDRALAVVQLRVQTS